MADTEPLPEQPTKDQPRATASRIVNLMTATDCERVVQRLDQDYAYQASGKQTADDYTLKVVGRSALHVLQGIAGALDRFDPTGEAQSRSARWLAALVGATTITEERHQSIDTRSRRGLVNHTLTLHRDGVSADDIRAVLDALEGQGMPGTASITLDMPSGGGRTALTARWSVEP